MVSPPLEIPLKSWEEIVAFFSHDIDTMTLLVPMPSAPAIGTILLVSLRGPTDAMLPMRVKVTEHVPGTGARVAFDALTNEDRQRLADWLAECRVEPPPPPPQPPEPPKP
ncbi:MAG: hypothetical protein OXT09_29630, partial [Myxococcales bacterium]|nr:hypothetical protein [Myxococcales bacterium]